MTPVSDSTANTHAINDLDEREKRGFKRRYSLKSKELGVENFCLGYKGVPALSKLWCPCVSK